MMISRSMYPFRSCRGEDTAIRHRIREIAQMRVRYAY